MLEKTVHFVLNVERMHQKYETMYEKTSMHLKVKKFFFFFKSLILKQKQFPGSFTSMQRLPNAELPQLFFQLA